MIFRWICECGEEFDGETITKAGFKAMNHQKKTKKHEGVRHNILGLMNMETGEIVFRGFNMRRAEAEFGPIVEADTGEIVGEEPDDSEPADTMETDPDSQPAPEPMKPGEPVTRPQPQSSDTKAENPRTKKKPVTGADPKTPKASGTVDTKKPKGFQSNMIFTLTGWHILIPASAMGLFALGTQTVRRNDGTKYAWDPDGFGDYVWDVFRQWHEERMPQILGLAYSVEGREAVIAAKKILDRIDHMTDAQAEDLLQNVQRDAEMAGIL